MMIKLFATAILLPLIAAGCGNRAAGPSQRAGTEFEQLRGPDIARARQLYAEKRENEGAAILRALVSNPDWNVRSHAIRAIGEVRDRTLLPEVHAALRDDRLEVRESAGRIMAWMGDSSSRGPLRAALSDREGIVRSHAAAALIAIGGVDELDAVREIVENDADPTARAATARILGELRDPAVLPVLVGALDDESAMVRGEAADAIGAAGFPDGRRALETLTRNDPDPGVRERAAAALRLLDATNSRKAP